MTDFFTWIAADGLPALFLASSLSCLAGAAMTARVGERRSRRQDGPLLDELTGLPNRASVCAMIARLTSDPDTRGQQAAGLVVDIDRFKEINDAHGHAAGDYVLRTVAGRISRSMRDGEHIGRIGSDEFAALKLPVESREEALRFAEGIRELVAKPIDWNGKTLSVRASVGMVVYPWDGSSPSVLIERADIAMYAAKRAGRNNVTAFRPEMEAASRTRSQLAMDLRCAVANGELSLVFQPQNDAATEAVIGFEALLRWNHPQHGTVSPAAFIPLAEEDPCLIGAIGEWVLREACREAASWSVPIRVAVNVAQSQLGRVGFPSVVQAALQETGLDPARLELEVTETGLAADQKFALQVIRELKSLGVRVAMDDFGTGYSSLSMLQRFPFDKIKIDREFTAGIGACPEAEAIIRATVALGCALGKPVLAEGVETEAQMAFLRNAGCHEVQGFLFGMPTGSAGARSIAGSCHDGSGPREERRVLLYAAEVARSAA